MNENEKKFKESLELHKRSSFTESEKSEMHNFLLNYIDNDSKSVKEKDVPVLSTTSYSWLLFLRKPAFVILVLLILGGGSIAYASGNSIPGDTLYDIKRNIVEPIRGALAISENSKIRFQAYIAEERLDEAISLQMKNRLTKENQENLETDFTTHIGIYYDLTKDKETTNDNVEFSKSISAKIKILVNGGLSEDSLFNKTNNDLNLFSEDQKDLMGEISSPELIDIEIDQNSSLENKLLEENNTINFISDVGDSEKSLDLPVSSTDSGDTELNLDVQPEAGIDVGI